MKRFFFLPILLLVLVAAFYVYQPGLSGPFLFDDIPNILNNTHIAIQDLHKASLTNAAFSSTSGPLRRPITILSFAFNYYTNGFDVFYFKATNLAIHLVNGIGIFMLSNALLRIYRKKFDHLLSAEYATWISIAIASAWIMHPFNLASVLYVVQRMTSLSALFTIYGLVLYIWGRMRSIESGQGTFAILISILLFTPLAALCKENGVLLPIFALTIESIFFQFQAKKYFVRYLLISLYVITVAVPAITALTFVSTHPAWLMEGYKGRDFTLPERVFTEARVLWFYLKLIILPRIADMGLFHDDITNSHGLLTPITTLFSLFGIAALLATSWFARKKAPLIAFGILFFFTGHILESTVFPFEITFEHRNYLPMYGIILPMFFYLLYPLKYVNNLRLRQIIAILFTGLLAFSTYQRSTAWASPIAFANSELAHHPNSARDNVEMGNIYASLSNAPSIVGEQNYLLANQYLQRATALDPNYMNGLFGLISMESIIKKNVEEKWIDELRYRLMHSPASNNTGSNLIMLVGCVVQKKCNINNEQLGSILFAALQNSRLTGPNRALVLSALSYYQIDLIKDYPAAIISMNESIVNDPQTLDLRISLIKFLVALRYNDEAKSQLIILKHLDSLNAFTSEISAQEKILAMEDDKRRQQTMEHLP